MGTRGAGVIVSVAVVVVVAGGMSVWWYLRPSARSDCAIVYDMIAYSKSDNARIRELIPASIDDPQKLVDAYQRRQTRLRQYAGHIRDSGLREKAYAVVDLEATVLDAWRRTIPGRQGSDSSSTSQAFQRAYTDYAAQSQKAGQALQAACPAS